MSSPNKLRILSKTSVFPLSSLEPLLSLFAFAAGTAIPQSLAMASLMHERLQKNGSRVPAYYGISYWMISRFFRYVTPTPPYNSMIELHWLKLDLAVKDRWPIELLAYSNHGGSWRLVESLVDGKWIKFDNLKLIIC